MQPMLKSYFTSSTPQGEKPKDMWRHIVGVFMFVLLCAVGIGWYTTKIKPSNVRFSLQAEQSEETLTVLEKPATELAYIEGGDVTFDPPHHNLPILTGVLPNQDEFTAEAMIVKDHETGLVLYQKNEHVQRPLASVTKLMSALVLMESVIDWESTATVVPDDLIDTHMYAGDTYTMEELWQAALIASSNKAIFTLADNVGWPREAFVERMNQKALELGMTETVFVEPTGLDSGNISTAADLTLLLAEALKIEKIKKTLLQPEVTLYSKERNESNHMWNTNWLLLGWVPSTFTMHGGKTGYITASGYNFVMQAEQDEKLIDVIVLGADVHEARFTEARDIAEAVFANYTWQAP